MMSASSRVRRSVLRMTAYTPGEQPRAEGILKLNTNENPYPPSPLVEQAARECGAEALRRYPDPLCGALRARIAELHGCGPDNVFVGNGSDEILALATRAFVEDDGSIGCFDPSYSLYPVLAAIRGVVLRPVALGGEFEWREPPGDDALFFLARPNAPPGTAFPVETVAAFCRRARGVVLVDEAYVDFAADDCVSLALGLPNVLVSRTLSKSYSLAGLRLGYALGSRDLIEALFKIKDSYNVDALAQALGLAALRDVEWMRRNAARVRGTRARLEETLRRRGWRVWPSQANFVWARPPGRPAAEWFEALRARKVYVRHFPGPATGACLRITVGTEEQTDRLLEALDACEKEGA